MINKEPKNERQEMSPRMNQVQEVQEQIQEDIRTYLDEQPDYIIDALCDIVIKNMARLKNNP